MTVTRTVADSVVVGVLVAVVGVLVVCGGRVVGGMVAPVVPLEDGSDVDGGSVAVSEVADVSEAVVVSVVLPAVESPAADGREEASSAVPPQALKSSAIPNSNPLILRIINDRHPFTKYQRSLPGGR